MLLAELIIAVDSFGEERAQCVWISPTLTATHSNAIRHREGGRGERENAVSSREKREKTRNVALADLCPLLQQIE
jgi:hypothetical protein